MTRMAPTPAGAKAAHPTSTSAAPADATSVPMPPIAFGTDGWRARVADEYTFENVRRCAEGVARWVVAEGAAAKGVVVAWDRRFVSEYFARPPPRCSSPTTSRSPSRACPCPPRCPGWRSSSEARPPASSSPPAHNPWTDNGFKIKAPTGSAGSPQTIAAVERVIRERAADTPPRRPFADAELAGLVEWFDPFERYRA